MFEIYWVFWAKFRGVAAFVLGKMIKRYKKHSRPRFIRRIKFKIFGFLIKMLVCKGYSSKFMASERVKFVTAFVLLVAFVNLHR